jgi:hypothetical protein
MEGKETEKTEDQRRNSANTDQEDDVMSMTSRNELPRNEIKHTTEEDKTTATTTIRNNNN